MLRIEGTQQQTVVAVDRLLESEGLPTYSMLLASMEKANKIVLSPRTQQTPAQRYPNLYPQENETICDWSVRYVDAMLSIGRDHE